MGKNLQELVSEMLIKQDRTNEILEEFMSVSVKLWELQTKFNERFLEENHNPQKPGSFQELRISNYIPLPGGLE